MVESPYPPYIPLRTIVWGRGLKLETTAPLRVETHTVASRALIWRETAETFFPAGEVRTPPTGLEAVIELPRTDLTGWVDVANGDPVAVSIGPSHTYTTTVRVFDGDRKIDEYTIGPYVVPDGVGAIDGDLMRFDGLAPSPTQAAFLWNLTGGADFPPAAKVGEWGLDLSPVQKPDGEFAVIYYRKG